MMNKPNPWDTFAQDICFKDEKEMLTTFYETKSINEIATLLNCGPATVARRMNIYGIRKRARGGAHIKTNQRYKLFHMDQRYIMFLGISQLSAILSMSKSLVYKYRLYKSGNTLKGYNLNSKDIVDQGMHK